MKFAFGGILLLAILFLAYRYTSTSNTPPKADAHAEHQHDHKQAGHKHSGHKHAVSNDTGVISLDLFADGSRAHLLVGRTGATPSLEYVTFTSNTWSDPAPVSKNIAAPKNMRRGNDARIASHKDKLIAIWSEAGTGWGGGGPFVTAISSDGGKTWTRGGNPADDNSTGGHAFGTLSVDGDGRLHMAWLDSRNKRQGLRYSNSSDFGKTWSANVTIDDESCECCWNTILAASPRDIAVLYRDKNPRDMAFARSTDGGVTWKTAPAGKFDWAFNGCPEVGGGVCAIENGGAVEFKALVWTGETTQRGLFLTSTQQGVAPQRLGPPAASRPDLARHSKGEMAAVYSGLIGENIGVYICKSADGGATWTEPVKLSADDVSAHGPRVVPFEQGFLIVWTESKSGSNEVSWAWKKI